MKSFKDTKGREWVIVVNVDTIKRVRGLAAVDLLKLVEGSLAEDLAADPVKFCEVLWACIQPQAQGLSVDDKEFFASLTGDAVEQATLALLNEAVDFFPSQKRRVLQRALRVAIETAQLVEKESLELAEKVPDHQIATAIRLALNKKPPGKSSGSSPVSSRSTRAR